MCLDIENEILALWPSFGRRIRFERFSGVDLPVSSVNRVQRKHSSSEPHRRAHEIASVHPESLSILSAPLTDQVFDVLLILVLGTREDFFVGHDLGRDWRINTLELI